MSGDNALADDLFCQVDTNAGAELDFNGFKQAALKPTSLEQWASSLPLPQLLADAMPRFRADERLRLTSQLSETQISAVCHAFLVGIRQAMRVPLIHQNAGLTSKRAGSV